MGQDKKEREIITKKKKTSVFSVKFFEQFTKNNIQKSYNSTKDN